MELRSICRAALVLSWSVLLGGAMLALTASAQQDAQPAAQVIALLRAGRADEALAVAERLTAANPRSCQLWSLRGVAEQALSQSTAALSSFRHALGLCPASLPALEGAAQIEFAMHDPEAEGDLHSILAERPSDPVSHAMLASVLAQKGECAAALSDFAAAEPLFAAQPQLLHDYGACLLATGRWAQAVDVYTQLNQQQRGPQVTLQLAYAQWKAGDAQQALATLRPLLDEGTDEQVLRLGSSIAQAAGSAQQAVALLRSAIVLDPKNVDNYLAFARLAEAYQSYQVGVDMLNVGMKVLPDAAPLYVARGVLLAQLSQVAAATEDFERAHQLDPHLASAMDAVGILEEQQHADAQSLALFRRQAALHPDDALLQYLFAEALSEQSGGDLKEAVAAALRASTLEPGYQPALDLLATLYLRTGQMAAAVATAEKALALDPNDTQALFAEIRAKSRLGDTKDVAQLSARLHAAQQANAAAAHMQGQFRLTDR